MPSAHLSPWHLIKFDSASLTTPETFSQLFEIVNTHAQKSARCLVIIGPSTLESGAVPSSEDTFGQLESFADQLLPAQLTATFCEHLGALHAATEIDELRTLTFSIQGKALLLAALLNNGLPDGAYLDSTRLIHSQGSEQAPVVDSALSTLAVQRLLAPRDGTIIPVFTGGIASHASGNTVFLTPGGSDRTATILGRILQAASLTIWTDVPGIQSADPQYVSDAHTLPNVSFREAAELAYLSSGVLHPKTFIPLQDHPDIEIAIKHIHAPDAPGTRISGTASTDDSLAKAVTAQSGLALLVIEGLGMMGVPGIMAQALDTLAAESINVVMLSQASTEQSAGVVIQENDKNRALAILEKQFDAARDAGDIQQIYTLGPVGIVTVVDDNMRYRPGLTGKMFSTLGRSGINVLTMAEGASETNISAVVDSKDLHAAVQALHEAFCLSRRRAHVFIFGAGTIGQQLLALMDQEEKNWLQSLNLKICLVGLANSRQLVWNTRGIPFDQAISQLDVTSQPCNLQTIVNQLIESRLDRLIVIDATASDEIAHLYPLLLENNIAVVTPNKRANTLDSAFYQRLTRAARVHQVPYLYETTVGAGLPIISTLRDLIRSGDEIIKIEGVLSGTLSFLFNSMAKGNTFPAAMQLAYDNGYTEPDPRDDLSGEDVARKMLILAREIGLTLNRKDVELEPLLPAHLAEMPLAQFLQEIDSLLADGLKYPPIAPGDQLHYIGRIEDGRIHIGIQAVSASSPFSQLQGSDNLIVFTTKRYFKNPLIIRGPGAGPAVTAGGVLADMIRAAELVT